MRYLFLIALILASCGTLHRDTGSIDDLPHEVDIIIKGDVCE